MTSQSIYTECVNLSPDHVAWLDGCGAKWGSGDRLSELKSYTRVEFMCVDDTWYFMSTHNNSFTHIPTGSEFCEQVAEILGIDKPRFGKSLDEDCMSCKCIDQLNKSLKTHLQNETANIPIIITGDRSGQPFLIAEYNKVTKKGLSKKLFNHMIVIEYCPFCGVKYERT